MKLKCPICRRENLWVGEAFELGDDIYLIIICETCEFQGYYSRSENIFKNLDFNPIVDRENRENKES